MIRILFVCHGNICRSPMAEFVMKQLVADRKLEDCFEIASAATSTEEIGNDVYPPAQRCLSKHNIAFSHRRARQLKRTEVDQWDYIIGMDRANIRNIERMLGPAGNGKVFKFMTFAGVEDDVADPWYTGDFEETFDDVMAGCLGLLEHLGY